MAVARMLPVYDQFLDYLIEKATPQEILAFKVSDDAQQYARILLERHSAGLLTPEDQLQLDQMRQFERMMSLLKSKALVALKKG